MQYFEATATRKQLEQHRRRWPFGRKCFRVLLGVETRFIVIDSGWPLVGRGCNPSKQAAHVQPSYGPFRAAPPYKGQSTRR